MPNYIWRCPKCNETQENFFTMQEVEKISIWCPRCKNQMTRLIGAGSGIIFKGSDWPGRDISRASEKGK